EVGGQRLLGLDFINLPGGKMAAVIYVLRAEITVEYLQLDLFQVPVDPIKARKRVRTSHSGEDAGLSQGSCGICGLLSMADTPDAGSRPGSPGAGAAGRTNAHTTYIRLSLPFLWLMTNL
ncbi:hypothetical protein evm_008048, partial [Chilo suppressalis]